MVTFTNSYEEGKAAAPGARNPYITTVYQGGDREDRMDREVNRRRWDAGFQGKLDPYPKGWFG
jgi:hypothetical protein